MFGTLGGPELVLILVLALVVFGPRKLPEIGRSMGKLLAEFRKASHEFQRTIEDEVEAEKARPPAPVAPTPLDAPAAAPAAQPAAEATVSREAPPPPVEPR